MTSSANCVICAACIKNCPNESIQLTVRKPTKELWLIRKPKIEEAFLSAVIMGIVFVQNVTMLEVWNSMLRWLEKAVGTTNYVVTFSITFAIALIIPVALLGLTSWIAGKFNQANLVENFARFGYTIIALDVAGHIAHNLFAVIVTTHHAAWTIAIPIILTVATHHTGAPTIHHPAWTVRAASIPAITAHHGRSEYVGAGIYAPSKKDDAGQGKDRDNSQRCANCFVHICDLLFTISRIWVLVYDHSIGEWIEGGVKRL
jgi:hypothetical protein